MKELKFEVQQSAGVIKLNFDELEKQLGEKLKEYDGAIFTEASIPAGKGEVANLRKLKKQIEESNRQVKAQWMEPYLQFDARVKRLLAIVDQPIDAINLQLSAYEKSRIEKKKLLIHAIYSSVIGTMEEYLPLEKIYNSKWENKTVNESEIRKEMIELIETSYTAVLAIKAMNSDSILDALALYKRTLSLADAVSYINRYESQKIEIMKREAARKSADEERQKQAEIERIRADERRRMAEEQRIREEVAAETVAAIKTVDEESAAPITLKDSVKAVYTVVATEEELVELEMAITSLGIYFERKDSNRIF